MAPNVADLKCSFSDFWGVSNFFLLRDRRYVLGCPPCPGRNRHHKDYYIFSRGSKKTFIPYWHPGRGGFSPNICPNINLLMFRCNDHFKDFYSWWLNQPIWKICASQIGSFPQGSGVKIPKMFELPPPSFSDTEAVSIKFCDPKWRTNPTLKKPVKKKKNNNSINKALIRPKIKPLFLGGVR